MSDIAVKTENLSKSYKLYKNPIDRLKESLNPFRKKYHHDFFALKNISFEIKKGETIGIIGRNGSGKSTLLKIITKVLTPTEGNVITKGKISALLELGAGFNPELNGMENIYFNGAIMGYTKKEIDKKLDNITSFADIGEFIEQPVKTYSSGMFVRLAFAVATNVDPEILIIDEALSVGDMFFQAKCMAKMKKMIDKGITLIFVSHDTGAIKSICQRSILLDEGSIVDFDKSDKIVEKYFVMKVQNNQKTIQPQTKAALKSLNKETKHKIFSNSDQFTKRASYQRIQNGMANFVNIQLLDENENVIQHVEYEQNVILRMALQINNDMEKLAYGYHIRDKNGIDVVYSDSIIEDKNILNLKKGSKYIIDWRFKSSLIHGIYNVACVLSVPIDIASSKVDFVDFIPIATQFEAEPRKKSYLYGNVHWDNTINIQGISP
ncbi:MAG: ABC transporter ATP-binding protein, lipopolysaccharide transport system ATP-binding protein [Candidatus Peregrinibacteria bacterium GW2011_GWC2_39_14]|nr:MAG: ABC transporter ATP-binding protein [Candidatus Peregrinibacteria bacterium GW2011_GWA2_38_36]KKR05934.1 MAG: ABC transporter ATP-binding protein, lipopolysaccharide transport system ATP-binding protein [Candidatus Peregrinibacteria bacterium GW2011_GWC2_39_14]